MVCGFLNLKIKERNKEKEKDKKTTLLKCTSLYSNRESLKRTTITSSQQFNVQSHLCASLLDDVQIDINHQAFFHVMQWFLK